MLSSLEAGLGEKPRDRVLLSRARAIGERLVAQLLEHPAVVEAEMAGSARRWADSVKDLDIVVAATDPAAVEEAFAGFDAGIGVDLRIVEPGQYGNLLQHFTGSARPQRAPARADGQARAAHLRVRDPRRRHREDARVRHRGGGLRRPRPALDPARDARGPWRARSGEDPAARRAIDLRGDLHMHTVASDGATRSRRWRGRRWSAATSTSPSPTTRRRTASATTCRPTSSGARSSGCAR